MFKRIFFLIILTSLGITAADAEDSDWTPMLDADLSQWEVFIGVPHGSVQDLPNVPPDSDGKTGTPLGLNNDPRKVFRIVSQDGEPVLHISGEIYGALSSLKEYSNYHIRLQVKWGEKKWPPRLDAPRDSGLLYHCTGEHGEFWNVWMRSLECQIQEHDCGDFFQIAGTSAMISAVPGANPKLWTFKPGAEPVAIGKRPGSVSNRCARAIDAETQGDWNTVEVITIGDRALHIVNGQVNNALRDTRTQGPDGLEILDHGRLQIQSEGAEVFYRRIEIRPVTEFPADLLEQAGWQ